MSLNAGAPGALVWSGQHSQFYLYNIYTQTGYITHIYVYAYANVYAYIYLHRSYLAILKADAVHDVVSDGARKVCLKRNIRTG